ncbi:mitochondrial import receptor subunit TOM40 homolog 2 isoform X1 [Stomoxys calcitrans]|uniref:mitochondrial import receptor subunit TOM40 homolog 2 isoform X1 n=1 Tax=Stomoxys calcitrans TaxID=35570 RepID=UPI0027E38181|nr:mitochondrial import receptor subunit TOM40 homolog 2 isoform X1 [Stomoxys calcitrans]
MNCEWCPPKCNVKFPPCFYKYPGTRSKTNPGSVLELHCLANGIKPDFVDGIKLDYHHRLGRNKAITANWTLSHNEPSGFRFGGIYTAHLHGDIMQTPTIHADINPTNFSTNIGIIYYPFRCLRIQANLQRAAEKAQLDTQTCIEWCTNASTLTTTLYNARTESGRGTLSYLRALNEQVALGGELLVEWNEPHSVMTDIAFVARYRQPLYSLAATVSRQGIDVSYWQRLHRKIKMATLWAWQRKTGKSLATVCYQWNFEDAYVRGKLDSDLSVGVIYSSRILPHVPIGMDLSLLMNLSTNRFVFGLNFTLDPSGLRKGE